MTHFRLPRAGKGGAGANPQTGGGTVNHQVTWLQGGHLGQTAPCSIAKTYTTYEDRDLGDGCRGSVLWGGVQGFNCNTQGKCTGAMQAEPVQMLGTDSHGCCCSAGENGLGLPMNQDKWTLAYTRRYPECDSQLQNCDNSICNPVAQCSPEVCQFEIVESPLKGTLYAYNDDTTAGETVANCTHDNPCVVPMRYNYDQPNLVGPTGRFEVHKLLFRPEAGDVGKCDINDDPNCAGLLSNQYWTRDRQTLFRYTQIKFQVRTFTWMYIIPEGNPASGYGHKMESKEFLRTPIYPFVEKIEDAYQKLHHYNIFEPFSVQACPCRLPATGSSANAQCNGLLPPCANLPPAIGVIGRLMIIDVKRMLGFDAGTDILCDAAKCPNPNATVPRCPSCLDCADRCHTAAEKAEMIAEVKAGCKSGSCFSKFWSLMRSTGVGYQLLRNQSGVSPHSKVWTRVIPYNDRPSVGGAGAALRFDGIDDMAAATIKIFPRDAFTVMFWIKGIISERRNQGVMQFIAEDKGLQLQIYNSDNLEIFVLDKSSGPTGVNINSDLSWHHVAVTWTRPGAFMHPASLTTNNTYQGPGVVRLFVDCKLNQDASIPRSAQSNKPGGSSAYVCAHAINEEGWAWSGELSNLTSRMSARGEVSIGQRMACNATTANKRRIYDRAVNLEHNQTYCRRKMLHECDPKFNATPSLHHPGIYSPESDCKLTVLGLYLSGGNETFTRCLYNASDPYGTIVYGPIQKQMALDWSLSNDGDPTSGSSISPYTIPLVTQVQSQNFFQTDCTSGCYRNEHALLGYLDELRIYNFTMTSREIAFRSRATVRDGVNCDDVEVPQAQGIPPIRGCSHMIDPIYKLGLMLYWPFDDPFPSYAGQSTEAQGQVYSPVLSLSSYDYAAVGKNKMGNYHSGLGYAMSLGGGRHATAPMRVPSTAPVFGARHDFILYPRGTLQLFDFKIGDVDTCVDTMDVLSTNSDSYFMRNCDGYTCSDSHCQSIKVQVQSQNVLCDAACQGKLFRPAVREECQHPESTSICGAYPECAGDLCFENSGNSFPRQNGLANVFYIFTGEYMNEGDLTAVGRRGKCQCEGGSCTPLSFTMIFEASGKPTGDLGSYTGYTVKIQDGVNVAYRTVLCHGDRQCDPREGYPLPGRTLTMDRPIPFTPTTESYYWIIKGKYKAAWKAYYFSDIVGGGGIHADRIQYDVYDIPGEAGTVWEKVLPTPSYQTLRFKSSLNPDAVDNAEILGWNQPQMQGNIVIGSLGVPIPMKYNVSVPEDAVTLMSIDIIFDDDNHVIDFNLTVNGPQEFSLMQQGNFGESGDSSGDLYQVLDVHCGMVKKDSKCVTLKDEQIVFSTGKSGFEEVTYCEDPTYIESDSLMEQLKRSYELFNYGIISKVCTYNENATEIWNITGYNYTCLPPCTPTLYTYQIIAVGCIENCTSRRSDLICDNTYGLYPNQYACTGGEFHGQHCLGFDDVATCFSLTDQRAACQDRDLQPGIRGTNLKYLLDKTDPAVMLHAIHTGDIHFVDWIHRGVGAVWSEICTDTAAALGYELILRYLIKNGCPWRDSAIEFANARGRVTIVQYLSMLRPPFGRVDPFCGCPGLTLHERSAGFRRCVPFSKSGLECYEKCGVQSTDDPSCQDGWSQYLADDKDVGLTISTDMGQFLIGVLEPPATARCSTGSKRALIRGPKIHFLTNETDLNKRLFSGSYIGFSNRAVVCDGMIGTARGEAPEKLCKPPGVWPRISGIGHGYTGGQFIDFLNFHVSDKDLRVLYIPTPGMTGLTAKFNFSVSRMSQHPRQYQGAPVYGNPIAARIGEVNIFIDPSNDYPDPKMQNKPYFMPEDQITVMKLHWTDVDTARKDVRVYIKEFPKHGDLYQVVEVYKSLNKSFGYNYSAHLLDPKLCRTTSPNCQSGNCDQPKDNCYYIDETFVIGEPIYTEDVTITQYPSAIYNTTRATIRNNPTEGATECLEIDRYGGIDMDVWGGEVFCEMSYFDNLPTTCRRCRTVEASKTTISPGAWSGDLLYAPVYTQRQDGTKPIDAPNVVARGGTCSLQEQCRLRGNVESKGSCIDWNKLAPNGRPTPYNQTAIIKDDTGNFSVHWKWSDINLKRPYPCTGPSATACTRDAHYLWPGYYEPTRITPVYPPQPLKDTIPQHENVTLTKYGDPVDTESFYSRCKEQDFHQFMAEYAKDVFMKGFDMHLSIPDGIFFRVLAWSSRFLTQDTYEMSDIDNSTMKVREDRTDGPKTFVTSTFSTTKRMQRKRRITKCGGEEWREVWRGHTQEGRPVSTKPESMQQGKDNDHPNLRFRFHPTNFTTKRLLVQSCGFMYQSAHNGYAGNPLDSFENLMLIGAHGSKPKALVTDSLDYRVAYVPHPHFTGDDSFSFYGDDMQTYCEGRECLDRETLKIATVNLNVANTNDVPKSAWMEVTGGPGETIEFELIGVDASPDFSNGWIEWGTLGLGQGQGSRGGYGPLGEVETYTLGQSDFLGSPDSEPDDALTVIITKEPELGTLVAVGGRTFRFTPPANGGGKPLAIMEFKLKDKQGIISPKSGKVYINYICQAGYFVNQLEKKCSECPKGFYKPSPDDRTSCITCNVGTYGPALALTTCMNCAAGKYQPRPASSSCLRCRIGHFTDETGSKRCLPCSPGTYAPRINATTCLHCGTLSYAPLPGMFRCYDCPRLSWSSVTDSSDVANCKCPQGTYKNAIFNESVNQLWSPDSFGIDNNSFVTPTVNIIKDPWPERLQLVSSNCSACPEGSFCHGAELPPVTKMGYWTDWETADKKFWENHVDAKFFKCDANNLREVCLGYPALDLQEQNEICSMRVNWGFCDNWPRFNYTKLPDIARCKAGYEDVVCSKCIGYELQQCVPKGSDSVDAWFSWKKFAKERSYASYFRAPLVDCYAIGSCSPDDSIEKCEAKRNSCKDNEGRCIWRTNRYYRSFDGSCSVCPLSVLAGLLFYLTWFALFCAVILCILGLALTDMNSFSITFTFWQTAALLARYRIAWPKDAQTLLSFYSVANVNLDGIPWMCFFNSAPGFRDIWFLTNLSIGALVAVSIVRWILPFLAVPPRGQVLIQQFKSALSRRDMLKGAGSVARVQYLRHTRLGQNENLRPSSVAPSQRSRRPSTAPSRPSTGGSRLGDGLRPTSALSGSRSQGSSHHADDIVIEEEIDIENELKGENQSSSYHGASFGSRFAPQRCNQRRPATLSEELPLGPRSRASLFPSGSVEDERAKEMRGAIVEKSLEANMDMHPSFGSDMILEEVPEDFVAGVGFKSRSRRGIDTEKRSIRDRAYGASAIRIAGGSFGLDFFKLKSAASRAAGSTPSRPTAALNEDRPESAQDLIESQDAESRALDGSAGDMEGIVTSDSQPISTPKKTAVEQAEPKASDTLENKNTSEAGAVTPNIKAAGAQVSKLLSFSKTGAMSAMSKACAGLANLKVDTKASGDVSPFEPLEGGIQDPQAEHSKADPVSPTKSGANNLKESSKSFLSFAKSAGEKAAAKATEHAKKAKEKAAEQAKKAKKKAAQIAAAASEASAEGGPEGENKLQASMRKTKAVFSLFSSPKKTSATAGEANPAHTRDKIDPRAQSGTSMKSRPRSALRPPRAPDVLVLEDVNEITAVSRPISAVSRPWSAATGISRPESAKSVSFQGSRPGTAPSRRRPMTPQGATDMAHLDHISGRMTPSRIQRERDGWREYNTDNPFQAHTPRMDQRLNSARSDGSSKEVPMDLGGIAWYVRKQYFDMAWRHAVAMLSILYICSCQKTLQALKWTWWTYSPVSKTAVLDYDPSVRIFDINHGPVFPFALMALPVTVCGPAINFFMLYTGYRLRALDDTSFSMRWGYLLDPFERKYWYWSLIIAVRKFVFVFSQTFLRNSLYSQKFYPAVAILANIILNYSLRPYRVERHNVYENILLVCLLFILLLGMISPLDVAVYHDAKGRNNPGPYDDMIVLGVLVIMAIALFISFVVMYADIIDAQLRTPKLVKALYLLTLGPIEMVLRIVHNILELIFGTLWWLLGKIGMRKQEQPDSEDTPTSSARMRAMLKKKKQKSRYINPQAMNRGAGDPPFVTGDRYADIMWEKVFGMYKTKKKIKVLNSMDDDYDELVRPDDGARWLRDKFSIRKRIFVIEKRLQCEALYDPKSTTILRMERQLTVAIDAAVSQLKRERDSYFDQLYDSQTEYEAICIDRDVAQGKLDKQDQALIVTEDASNFAQARLDATIRRTGQPEDWKKKFLEVQVGVCVMCGWVCGGGAKLCVLIECFYQMAGKETCARGRDCGPAGAGSNNQN